MDGAVAHASVKTCACTFSSPFVKRNLHPMWEQEYSLDMCEWACLKWQPSVGSGDDWMMGSITHWSIDYAMVRSHSLGLQAYTCFNFVISQFVQSWCLWLSQSKWNYSCRSSSVAALDIYMKWFSKSLSRPCLDQSESPDQLIVLSPLASSVYTNLQPHLGAHRELGESIK